jgi:hypothetical protein
MYFIPIEWVVRDRRLWGALRSIPGISFNARARELAVLMQGGAAGCRRAHGKLATLLLASSH